MRTLIVGVGALGGLIAARMKAIDLPVSLATRNAESAEKLKQSGLQVSGVGEPVSVDVTDVAPLNKYFNSGVFDLIILATKAHDAIDAAPRLLSMLKNDGSLLPIQNGGVSQLLADQLLDGRLLCGISNFGVTMLRPGLYEQRNAGNFLIGEIAGGASDRVRRIHQWLGRAVEVKTTPNLSGSIWSKLLLNCSVTTIGAIAGQTMRQYILTAEGRRLFVRAYDEALSVAIASGVRPERMMVDPVPPTWNKANGRSTPDDSYNAWLDEIVNGYGDLKASMLQDFERGRPTEINFINVYVVNLARQLGISARANAAIVETVHAITRKQLAPDPSLLRQILQVSN